MIISKTCTKCGEDKAASEFSKDNRAKSGLQSRCKACADAYHATPKAQATRLAYNAELRAALTVSERSASGSVRAARLRSDLSSVDLYGGLTYTEACTMTLPFAKERLRLEALTGIPHHIDHIISLKEGGTHTAGNLQVLTASDNLAKG